ncbi:hypothetical protein WH96_04470 [Kiloniella spongiae]|uniref:YeeE/YedE family protein n=1 Tax=Kiloniella spongiae TaxID=1489064 RepID=A0A0H2MY20_9PROT|nr:YeeE/YedE family protein [Kiloniella spongiae]KLN61605.1 hypothetical protein WH96_04470 [Kiloniella spongiae]
MFRKIIKQSFVALIVGVVFGLGLIVSGMVNPAKILAFLDVAGDWDPSLAFVMGGALITTGIGYRLIFFRKRPVLSPDFLLPVKKQIDSKLVIGSVLFGLGWGITGLCPGPALTALTIGSTEIYVFLFSMSVGIFGFKFVKQCLGHS